MTKQIFVVCVVFKMFPKRDYWAEEEEKEKSKAKKEKKNIFKKEIRKMEEKLHEIPFTFYQFIEQRSITYPN